MNTKVAVLKFVAIVLLLLNSFKLCLFIISFPSISIKAFLKILFTSFWVVISVGLLRRKKSSAKFCLYLTKAYIILYIVFACLFLMIDRQAFGEVILNKNYLSGVMLSLAAIWLLKDKEVIDYFSNEKKTSYKQ